jgi:hypothetical protein
MSKFHQIVAACLFCLLTTASLFGSNAASGLKGIAGTPATMQTPTNGSTLGGASVTFTWNAGTGVTSYLLYVGSVAHSDNIDLLRPTTQMSVTYNNIPTAGQTLYVTLFSEIAGTWVSEAYTYKESGAPGPATMVSPAQGSTLSGSSVTFEWTQFSGATQYLLYVGTTLRGDNVDQVKPGSASSVTLTNIPTQGKTLYVTLFSLVGSTWEQEAYTYTEAPPTPATMISPTPGSTLASGTATFSWTGNTGATSYLLYVGSVPHSDNIDLLKATTATSVTYNNLPVTGGTLYVTLFSEVNGVWETEAYTYKEATLPRVVWVPDFYGGTLQVRVGTGASTTAVSVALPTCNPNAVAVNSNKAYVVCNAYGDNPDKILVYNAATIRSASAGPLTISPTKTITSGEFNSLIGITFDASNNLWVASYGNSQVDEITAAELVATTPTVTAALIESPDSPVALAFDSAGGLWVSGQYSGGIVLHFPSDQVNSGDSGTPDYCLATVDVGAGCQFVDNVFLNPEGLALFNGDVWVANNATGGGGNVPGREIVDLKFSAGSMSVNATFGSSADSTKSPFVCPGGLYAGTVHLWLNDESYGETDPQCGAGGDVASATGGVFAFTPAQLAAQTTTVSQVLAYSNITGRPGFGGIFVENDQ